jgi:hypothetical protein
MTKEMKYSKIVNVQEKIQDPCGIARKKSKEKLPGLLYSLI